MYLHTSLSVLISFNSFSFFSPFCFFFSLHLTLWFMYLHTSLSVLISFISFSFFSPFCFFFSLHLTLWFMYLHTSLSVLISFISFSSFSPFFSLHLSLYLLFASRNLFLSILLLFHSLNVFTASFFSCSHSPAHHSFFLPVPFCSSDCHLPFRRRFLDHFLQLCLQLAPQMCLF
jgi:hypothetical protein